MPPTHNNQQLFPQIYALIFKINSKSLAFQSQHKACKAANFEQLSLLTQSIDRN